jgi:hypothetical protein
MTKRRRKYYDAVDVARANAETAIAAVRPTAMIPMKPGEWERYCEVSREQDDLVTAAVHAARVAYHGRRLNA